MRVEREFLVPINQRFGSSAPLAGMTQAALNSWAKRATALDDDHDIELIAGILREAAKRAELLADNSRDVFEADARGKPDGLAELHRMLLVSLS